MKMATQKIHGVAAGDIISFELPDARWWRRLLFWILRKGTPRRTIRKRVAQVSETTLYFDGKDA